MAEHKQNLKITSFKNWIINYLKEHKELVETDLGIHINESVNLISETVQKKTFTLWINAYLQQRNLKVVDLEKDLCDGVLLLNLLEIILKQKLVTKIHKANVMHKLDNLTIVVNTMQKNGIKTYGFSADDILQGRMKNILALTWALVCTFGVPDDIDSQKRPVTELLKEEHKPTTNANSQTKTNPQANSTSRPQSQAISSPPPQAISSPVNNKPVEIKPSTPPSPTTNENVKIESPTATKPVTSPTPMTNLPPPSQAKTAPPEDGEKEEDEDDIEASSQNYPGERFRVASAETIGVRRTMEDFIRIVRNFRGKSDEDLFCVFDGHGSRKPAEFSGENLPKTLETYLEKHGDETTKAMEETFIEVDRRMADWAKESGTTACVALIQASKLTVANVGDTRAVLCRAGKAMRLSFDHKPKVPSEKERIEKLGGFVAMGRVNAVLAVSRALGDSQVNNLVTAEPYVTVTQLQPEDEFLIVACDGVWDILEDQNAVDLIRNMNDKDAVTAAEELRNGAFNGGSNDNISVVVIFFKS